MVSLAWLPPLTSTIVETHRGTCNTVVAHELHTNAIKAQKTGPQWKYLLPNKCYSDEAVLSC